MPSDIRTNLAVVAVGVKSFCMGLTSLSSVCTVVRPFAHSYITQIFYVKNFISLVLMYLQTTLYAIDTDNVFVISYLHV